MTSVLIPLDDHAAVCDLLRRVRKARGWTQADLAEEAGYDFAGAKSYISQVELGKRPLPRLGLLAAWLKTMDVHLALWIHAPPAPNMMTGFAWEHNLREPLDVTSALRILRAAHNMQQVELAQELGLTRATVSYMEGNNHEPTIDTLLRYFAPFDALLHLHFRLPPGLAHLGTHESDDD